MSPRTFTEAAAELQADGRNLRDAVARVLGLDRLLDKVSRRLDRPRPWANAHRIADEHALDVGVLEREGFELASHKHRLGVHLIDGPGFKAGDVAPLVVPDGMSEDGLRYTETIELFGTTTRDQAHRRAKMGSLLPELSPEANAPAEHLGTWRRGEFRRTELGDMILVEGVLSPAERDALQDALVYGGGLEPGEDGFIYFQGPARWRWWRDPLVIGAAVGFAVVLALFLAVIP